MSRLTSLFLACSLAACSSEAPDTAHAAAESTPTQDVAVTEPKSPEDAAIRAVFAELQAAAEKLDGPRTRELLSSSSRGYWVHLRELAMHADKRKLQAEGPFLQLSVFVLRVKAGHAPIDEIEGEAMVDYALEQGLFGRETILGKELGEITIDGERAESTALAGGVQRNVGFAFVREGGSWRFDQTALNATANDVMQAKIAHDKEMDQEAYLFFLVGNATGTGGTEALWVPLAQQPVKPQVR